MIIIQKLQTGVDDSKVLWVSCKNKLVHWNVEALKLWAVNRDIVVPKLRIAFCNVVNIGHGIIVDIMHMEWKIQSTISQV